MPESGTGDSAGESKPAEEEPSVLLKPGGARELRALERGVPPRDFLPVLCEVSRVRSRRNLLSQTRSQFGSLGQMGLSDMSIASIGDISIQSASITAPSTSAPDDQHPSQPSREASILQGNARLLKRLEKCGLSAMKVADDGNCLFRACAAQLYGDAPGEQHPLVRQRAVAEMRRHDDRYMPFFCSTEEFEAYLAEMSAPSTWGDELVLRAIADSYGAMVHVVTSNEDNWYLVYSPEPPSGEQKPCASGLHIFLTYLFPIHYNGFEAAQNDESLDELDDAAAVDAGLVFEV